MFVHHISLTVCSLRCSQLPCFIHPSIHTFSHSADCYAMPVLLHTGATERHKSLSFPSWNCQSWGGRQMCPHVFTADCDKGWDRKQHRAASVQTKEWLAQWKLGLRACRLCVLHREDFETEFWKMSRNPLPGVQRREERRVFKAEHDLYTDLESKAGWLTRNVASAPEATECRGLGLGGR